MGLPGSLPIGMPVNFQNMGMLGGFPQMWATAAGQQYAGGLPVVNASQLHELYGGVNGGVEGPPPAHIQQPSSAAGDTQSSALYRWVNAVQVSWCCSINVHISTVLTSHDYRHIL